MKRILGFHLFLVLPLLSPATASAREALVVESREVHSAKEKGLNIDDLIIEKLDALCLKDENSTSQSRVIRDSFQDNKEYVQQNITRDGQTYVVEGGGEPHIIIKDYKCSHQKGTIQKLKESSLVQTLTTIFNTTPTELGAASNPTDLDNMATSHIELSPVGTWVDPIGRSAAAAKRSALNPNAAAYMSSVLNPNGARIPSPSQRALAKSKVPHHPEAEDSEDISTLSQSLIQTVGELNENGRKTLELQTRIGKISNKLKKVDPAALVEILYQDFSQKAQISNSQGAR